MEISLIMLFALIIGFGVVALRPVMKQHKKGGKEKFRYKNL
jgi:hypothetical protein